MTLLSQASEKRAGRFWLSGALVAAAVLCLALFGNGQTNPAQPASSSSTSSSPSPAPAQDSSALPAAAAPSQSAKPDSELNTQENKVTFQSRVNLVTVQVVVRDAHGAVVPNLKKEDFHLFDKGKPQVISRFVLQRPGSLIAAAAAAQTPKNPLEAEEQKEQPVPAQPIVATRFVAYLFDDTHIRLSDLMQVRTAATKHIDKSLHKTDRAAIYTTSGQSEQEFTDDLAELHQAIAGLRPHTLTLPPGSDCPDMTYFLADLIVNKNDTQALTVATNQTLACANLDPTTSYQIAQQMAQGAAQRMLSVGGQETRLTLLALRRAVHRLAVMPGERVIVLASPGFLALDSEHQEEMDLLDLANRSKVIINTLDARGLYTDSTFDASRPTTANDPFSQTMLAQYERMSATTEGDILGELADATAGTWFHNGNDLEAGFDKIATTPEVIYVLGFAPENLKYDGSYHKLKVTVGNDRGLTLQARRGYYAPRQMANLADQAKQEIREAVFSRDPIADMPLGIGTQFHKTTDVQAKLTVATRIDVRHLPFKRENDRNCDILTVVTALFDRNGNFVQAVEKTLDMKLRDATLANRLNGGIFVRADFDVTRGGYVIRSVVRDAQGQLMAAENGSVEIP